MPRFGRAFPMPRRGVHRAAPIANSVFASGTAKIAEASKTTAGMVIVVRGVSGTAKIAVSARGVAWIAAGPANPLDGGAGQRAEEVRFELLDIDGNKIGVIHPTSPGAITWNPANRISRTLSGLRLDPFEAAQLTPGQHRIRPVWVLADGSTYPLGVFVYIGAAENQRAGGTWVDCAPLPDRSFILDQKLSDMLQVLPSTVLTTAFAMIANRGGVATGDLSITVSGVTLGPTPLTYAAGKDSRLDAQRQLCDLLAYLPPHFDSSDELVARPVPVPDADDADHVYSTTGQRSRVIADSVTVRRTTLSPNVYLVWSTSPGGSPVFARYDVPADAPNSLANIGFEIVSDLQVPGLVDNTQAYAVAVAQAKRDAATARTVDFASIPDPRHDSWGVVEWDGERMLEVGWTLELKPGGKHQHKLAAVYT